MYGPFCLKKKDILSNYTSGQSGSDQIEVASREQPSVGTSATGHGLHLAARTTGLTGTQNEGSLEDGAECSEGSMHREGSMHARVSTTTTQRNFSEQSGSMGRVQGLDNIYGIYIFKKRVRVGGIVGVHKKKIYLVLQRERGLNRNMTCI